jgi:hypothetical protein
VGSGAAKLRISREIAGFTSVLPAEFPIFGEEKSHLVALQHLFRWLDFPRDPSQTAFPGECDGAAND